MRRSLELARSRGLCSLLPIDELCNLLFRFDNIKSLLSAQADRQ